MSNAVKFVHYGGPKDGRVGKVFANVTELKVKSPDPDDKREYLYERTSKRRFQFAGIRKAKARP